MYIKLAVLNIVSVEELINVKMFLLAVISLFAITTASSDLEVSSSPEPQVFIVLEPQLLTNVPNSDVPGKDIIQSHDDSIKNEEEKVIVLPSVPNAPELPPLDEAIAEMLSRIQLSRKKTEDKSENDKESKIIIRSKAPQIRFPSGYLTVSDLSGPDVILKV
ncbi:unnamed protein product, partial [Brenthis ino]